MKIISLNSGFGEHLQPLLEFVEQQRAETEVFCFQEMLFGTQPEFTPEIHARLNIFQEIQNLLPGFSGVQYFAPEQATYIKYEVIPYNVRPGLAIFYKKGLEYKATGGFPTYKNPVTGMDFGAWLTGNCQWIELLDPTGQPLIITQIHGMYQRNIDADTPERNMQSQIILDFIKTKPGRHLVIGDFNLNPTDESIAILGRELKDLIKIYGITDTRGKLYTNKPNKYADYAFVTKDFKVKQFRTLDVAVSDHLPLLLESAE